MIRKPTISDGDMWAQESPGNKGFKRSNLLFRPYDRGGMLFNKVVGAGCRSPHCLMNPVFRLQRFRSGVSRSIPELAGHHSVFNDLHRQTPRWLLYGLSITENKKKSNSLSGLELGLIKPTPDGNLLSIIFRQVLLRLSCMRKDTGCAEMVNRKK